MIRILLGAAAALALFVALPNAAPAQDKYPEQPVRLIVPFPQGGQNDLVGRLWARYVRTSLGEIAVENRGGAGGTTGSAEVARAKNDGYTLLLGNSTTVVINPAAMKKPPYDPVRDFTAVAVITVVPTAICVNPALPVKNLQDLIAFARKHPGKLSYGSAGTGSITNLTGELFKIQGGNLDIVHIPYKGAGPGLTDLVAGHIMVYTPILSAAPIRYHKSGKLRMLAVNAKERVAAVPDVPTAREAGMPGMVVLNFNAILTPAGTPKAVIDRLHAATMKVMADPALQKELRDAGAEPVTNSNPEKAARFIEKEVARWTPVIKQTGFTIN